MPFESRSMEKRKAIQRGETTKRVASVVVFKPGTTKEEAEKALEKIADLVDGSYYLTGKANVHEYESRFGEGPVFYIP